MKKKNSKSVLGRGLEALLNDENNSLKKNTDLKKNELINEIEINEIEINPNQPRKNFNVKKIEELGISIKNLGIIQPITVRKINNNKFQLISGERRLRASKLIGLKKIPSYIRSADDNQSLEMALIENIQRQDLDSIEIAISYKKLIEELSITQDELSNRIGKKRSTITNYLRLLKLDPIIQSGIRDGFLSMAHGRELAGIEKRKIQLEVYQKILSKGLSVRKTEDLIKKIKNTKKQSITIQPDFISDGEKYLEFFFKSKVKVSYSKKGHGIISIQYVSQKDFERIKNKLKK